MSSKDTSYSRFAENKKTDLNKLTTPMSALDELNAKQKAKEFKATQKAISSKDIALKLAALEKLNDSRYFTEGTCLQPFFDSLAPSKVICIYYCTLMSFSYPTSA